MKVYENCFSYVIYGKNEKYIDPVFQSYSKLSSSDLDFLILVFCDDVSYFSSRFSGLPKVKLVEIPDAHIFLPRIARFLAANYVSANYYHFRDSDSVLTNLEITLIKIEVSFGSAGFLIRNHRLHFAPMLAGLFSLNSFFACQLANLVSVEYIKFGKYYDQVFLSRIFYPIVIRHISVYTSHFYYKHENFIQISFDERDFCGRPIDFEVNCDESRSVKLRCLFFFRRFSRFLQSPKFIFFYKYVSGFCK